ncbi:MAG TPA: hypothetical protein VNS80_00570 [Pseudolysinimonas sp.]|nr:hypothetical protein [Pseudolysinimonas sp.]
MAQAKDDSGQPTPVEEVPEEIVVEPSDADEPDEILVEEAPTSESATATATLTDEKVESPLAGERVVYVSTPTPPKPRSNRIVGSLLALLGAVVFAVAYAGVAALLLSTIVAEPFRSAGFGAFIRDASFWVPVLFFAIGFVLVVLLLNRAAWWVHVLGSLLVAVIVYFGSIGVLLLLNSFAGDPDAGFLTLASSPFVVAAALVAREVSIWVGLLIALRGTKVKARNRADREAFDAEQSDKKASDGEPAASA